MSGVTRDHVMRDMALLILCVSDKCPKRTNSSASSPRDRHIHVYIHTHTHIHTRTASVIFFPAIGGGLRLRFMLPLMIDSAIFTCLLLGVLLFSMLANSQVHISMLANNHAHAHGCVQLADKFKTVN